MPVPDLSKLPPAQAEELRESRIEFEKIRPTLVGEALAEAYALLGAAYARSGFYAEAAVALEDAIALAPDDSRWIYAQRHRRADAEAEHRKRRATSSARSR